MPVYVWESVHRVTDQYHDDGGVVVRAASLDRARELIDEKLPQTSVWERSEAGEVSMRHVRRGEMDVKCSALTEPPDHVIESVTDEDWLVVFPNSGCC